MALVPAFENLAIPGSQGGATGLAHVRIGPARNKRWFYTTRGGKLWTLASENAAAGTELITIPNVDPFGPGTSGEGGLLSMAFDPDIETDAARNKIYFHYTLAGSDDVNIIARYTITDDGTTVSVSFDREVFRTPSGGNNHWGGDLRFGPDKFLYATFGDGGEGFDGSNPTANFPQKLGWLRGRMIRIDPRDVAPYAIPATNPFCTTANCAGDTLCTGLSAATLSTRSVACPESFVIGLRNPWRTSFDRTTGQIWIGDVGTGNEEINLASSGSNHGWPCRDGPNTFHTDTLCSSFDASTSKQPIAIYSKGGAKSVLGGVVYRGAIFNATLSGTYLFSDVYDGEIYAIDAPYSAASNIDAMPTDTSRILRHPDVTPAGGPRFRRLGVNASTAIAAYAEDENGEVYLLTFSTAAGRGILKLGIASGSGAADTFPTLLSQSGCVVPSDVKTAADGLIPYDINAPFWSDGATKDRWFALPEGTQITVGADGDFDFPVGTVLMKRFEFDGVIHETRLLVRHSDGDWGGYSYAWNSEQTDAYLVAQNGEQRQLGARTWSYPSRANCLTCHTTQAGRSLGLETAQLNNSFVYPGGLRANELATLDHVGLFAQSLGDPAALSALPDPFGAASLEERARAYLHTNCSQCHRNAARPDLSYGRTLAQTRLCDTPALVVPGNHEASKLSQLMHSTDPNITMPKGAGNVIDMNGVTLIDQWIDSLTVCE
jgi:uncharacterized repeat protein (TIGR03806 family)